MNSYGVRDVEKLLRLSRSTIRSLIASGFVKPARGLRGAWRFSFQDLIVLRTAKALADAHVSPRRIMRSMRELRRLLPDTMPLSGLNIGALADRVVVSDGRSRWQAESGQYVLGFDGDPADGSLSVIERADTGQESRTAEAWFIKAARLEAEDVDAAQAAYEQAIDADGTYLDAYINLGRLLHDAKRLSKAEDVYGQAIKACGDDPVLLFNLGVLLDDMKRWAEAMEAYAAALRADPALADGHYNLALLYEKCGKPKDAIRHMARYRVLTGNRNR
ncbi:MAG: tetratricopeptide repeat protein [Betaproteobacteria bacterium]